MPKAILVNMAGTQVGEVELSEAVFGGSSPTRPSSTRWSRTTWPTAGRAPRAP